MGTGPSGQVLAPGSVRRPRGRGMGCCPGAGGWLLRRQRGWRYGTHSAPADLHELLLGGPAGRRIAPAVDYLAGLFTRAAPEWARSSVDSIAARSPWHPMPSLAVLVLLVVLLATGTGTISAVFGSDRLGVPPATLNFNRKETVARTIIGVVAWAVFLFAVVALALTLARRPIAPGMAGFLQMPSARLLLALCLVWMLIRALTPVSRTPPVERHVSPAGVFHLDREASIVPMAVRRACWIVLVWLCFGPYAAAAYGGYTAVRLLCIMALGSVHTASGRFADARVWLACRRRMPVRPLAFLKDAHRRGGAAPDGRGLSVPAHPPPAAAVRAAPAMVPGRCRTGDSADPPHGRAFPCHRHHAAAAVQRSLDQAELGSPLRKGGCRALGGLGSGHCRGRAQAHRPRLCPGLQQCGRPAPLGAVRPAQW